MNFSIRNIKNKNRTFLFLLISIISLLNISNNEVLRIPFKTELYSSIPSNIMSEEEIKNYVMNLIRKNIYIELEIGTPSQKIKSYLKLEEFPFFIHGKDISLSNYNETKSLTYKAEKYPHVFLDGVEQIKWGYVSNDTINIINMGKTIKEFNFILVTETKSESPSNIGLMIPNQYCSIPEISFINQLKKHEIINDYSFIINYTNYEKGEGEFIIGGAPHFYDNKYNESHYKTVYAIEKPKYMMYGLEFNLINYGNETIIGGSMQCKFLSDFGLIAGTLNYYEIILEKFFDDKIKNKLCFKDNLKINIEWREGVKNFEYFYCKKNVNISEMQNLKFIHHEMNFIFEFNYNELFDEIDNYYIFKVIFPKSSNFYWMFGRPWLQKYLMVFDQDKKTLGYYNYIYDPYSTNKIKNENNKNNISIIIIVIILFIILVVFGLFFIFYCLKKDNRKKRINEINEDYEYSQENNNKDNLINNGLVLNE